MADFYILKLHLLKVDEFFSGGNKEKKSIWCQE